MESALSDILMLPQPADMIAFALRKAARERIGGQTKLSRVIMVSSTKGGTGKTSIAVNLAAQLAEMRLRTLLIDLDVQFGDVGIVLGLDRPEKTLHDLTAVADELDAEKLRGYVVRHGRACTSCRRPSGPRRARTSTRRASRASSRPRAGCTTRSSSTPRRSSTGRC